MSNLRKRGSVVSALPFSVSLSVSLLVFLLATGSYCRAETSKEAAWKLIVPAAHSSSAEKRVLGIRVLGLLPGNQKAIELAEGGLLDAKAEVRAAAATALGQMHSTASIPKLQHVMSDKEIAVALAAARALHGMKDKSAYEVYYAILAGQRKSGDGFLAEQTAILHEPKKLEVLAFEQGIGFVPFAGMGWDALRDILKNDPSPVQAAAATMLASDPDPASATALVNAAHSKRWVVRVAVLEAIAKRGDPTLRVEIEAYMYDPKEEVRLAAAAAVLHLLDIAEAQGKKAN
ncbi:MAG TPA: HEAT repeat domain-containing protein [Candidatus Sulfotelmatobacter sp.]|nr:HEAT repeat domain-containing protein [Candidatus Sulfotelmatobacter sp.]